MIQSIFTGAMGLSAQQRRLDVIADNLANVNTTAFKPAVMQFKDALYEAQQHPVDSESTNNLQMGFGVLSSSTLRDFRPGVINVTGNSLDFCLDGPGFFAVQDKDGSIAYTRNGAFSISNETDGAYLTNKEGLYVLDDQGQRIKVQGSLEDFEVGMTGEVREGKNESYAKIPVYDFPNLYGLSSKGRGLYEVTENSGEASVITNGTIRQGALENSGTNVALEMTRMIRAQRALSFASRAVRTADEMESTANTMRT